MPRHRRGDRPEPPRDRWERELDDLERQLRPYRLVLDDSKKRQYLRFATELYIWNRRVALLSRRDVDNLLWKHVGSSLGPLLLVTPGNGTKWVDIGTGAGLPGLILKIWEPIQEIHLVEGSRKKSLFLQEITAQLDLGPIPIHTLRAETLVERGERIAQFDLILARAVSSLARTLNDFGPLARPGGSVLTFKGPTWREDVEEATRTGSLRPGKFRLDQVLQIPWAPGHLLLLREDSGTVWPAGGPTR